MLMLEGFLLDEIQCVSHIHWPPVTHTFLSSCDFLPMSPFKTIEWERKEFLRVLPFK